MDHQPEPTLVELIRYNNWANAQVLAACLTLTDEQLTSTAPGTYGSIFGTLNHIIVSEAHYIHRITGRGPQPPDGWRAQRDLDTLADFAVEVASALLDTVQRVPPGQMVYEEEDGNTLEYKAMHLFIQVINHGIEHRTNITTILSGLGLPAPEVDGWNYLFSHRETFALKETFKDQPNADAQS